MKIHRVIKAYIAAQLVGMIIFQSIPVEAGTGTLGIQSFSKPMDSMAATEHALSAYLLIKLREISDHRKDVSNLTPEDFNGTYAGLHYEAENFKLSGSDGNVEFTCAVSGAVFAVVLDIRNNSVIQARYLGSRTVRAFPSTISKFTNISAHDLKLADDILDNISYVPDTSTNDALNRLSEIFMKAVMEAKKAGVFSTAVTSESFFKDYLDMNSPGKVPVSIWANDENDCTLQTIAINIQDADPVYATNLAAICAAMGKIFYKYGGYKNYKRSALLRRTAFYLDNSEPRYCHDWAQALRHCCEYDKADELLKTLLDKDPRNRTYIVEEANITFLRATKALDDLTRNVAAGSVNSNEFYGMASIIGNDLRLAIGIERMPGMLQYPRAVYHVGKGYTLMARLAVLRMKFALKNLSCKPDELQGNAAEVIQYMASGLRLTSRAIVIANSTQDEADHARNFFKSAAKSCAELTNEWVDMISRNGIILPNKSAAIRAYVREMELALQSAPKDLSAPAIFIPSEVRDIIETDDQIKAGFKRCLKTVLDSEVDNQAAFFDRFKNSIAESLNASRRLKPNDIALLAVNYANYYKNAPAAVLSSRGRNKNILAVDSLHLSIAYVYYTEMAKLKPAVRTRSAIRDLAGALIDISSDDGKTFNSHLDSLRVFLGLEIADEVEKPADKETLDLPQAATSAIKPAYLEESIDPGYNRNVIARLKAIESEYAMLLAWDGFSPIKAGFTGSLHDQLLICESAMGSYPGGVRQYLKDRDTKSVPDKDLRTKNIELATTLDGLEKRLKYLEERLSNKRIYVVSVIGKIISAKEEEVSSLLSGFYDIPADWIEDYSLKFHDSLAALRETLHQEDESFLSLHQLTESLETLEEQLTDAKILLSVFSTYRNTLKFLSAGELMLDRYSMVMGRYPALGICRERIGALRKNAFEYARSFRTYDDLTDGEKQPFLDIIDRMSSFAYLMRELRGILSVINTKLDEIPPVLEQCKKDALYKAETMVYDEIAPAAADKYESGIVHNILLGQRLSYEDIALLAENISTKARTEAFPSER
jgi:hypothetical protein